MRSGSAIVTTSWDDGHPADLRVAELLSDRALRGTFYVPLRGPYSTPTLTDSDVRKLHETGFEIGAHTVNHTCLTEVSMSTAEREIADSREQLEQRLSAPISMFCYPRGRFNTTIVDLVRKAGYLGARTTQFLRIDDGSSPYLMPTTIQAHAHPISDYLRNALRHKNLSPIVHYQRELRAAGRDWVQLGKRLFDRLLLTGGVFHLWGHSWEIEKFHEWDNLVELLNYISRRSSVQYCNNREIVLLPKSMPAKVISEHKESNACESVEK